MAEEKEQPQTSEQKGGYGKKPWWFWVLVYAVIGAIVYAIVYFLFFSGNGGGASLY